MVNNMLTDHVFWEVFAITWATAYASVYGVGYVLESRVPGNGPHNIPVWRDQAKAFVLGDIGLALLLAVAVYLGQHDARGWMLLVGTVIGGLVYMLARRLTYTPADYKLRAWNSPSKKGHDRVMYIVYVALLVTFSVPAYFTSWSGGVAERLVGLAGLLLWVVCMVIDLLGDEVPNDRQHPTVYQPIWTTWRVAWKTRRAARHGA
jgi:steroid 5-alpha reductase family enzyme